MTNIQAALGFGQAQRIVEIIARKRQIGEKYKDALEYSRDRAPSEKEWARSIYWMFGLVVDDDRALSAVELTHRLLDHGIQTRPFFLGMHEQPALHRLGTSMVSTIQLLSALPARAYLGRFRIGLG